MKTSDAPISQDRVRTWIGSCCAKSCWEQREGQGIRGQDMKRVKEEKGRGDDGLYYQVSRVTLPSPLCVIQSKR